MVERGEDTASVGDHADSDRDKPDAHDGEDLAAGSNRPHT